jgi:two-component system, NarL family, nitrate/nitrite response regulator NarL
MRQSSEDPVADVFVVAPVRVHRDCLVAAVGSAATINVVGEAAKLEEALPQLRRFGTSLVVLLAGARLVDLVVAAPLMNEPEAKLVAVGVPESEAVAWIEAGASGFLPPEGSLKDLLSTVERVARDELVASPQVIAHLANRVRRLAAEPQNGFAAERLTSREAEVLELLAEGLSNKQIAQRLTIEVQTVKNHVHKVLGKLGVTRRSEAAARVARRRERSAHQ